VGAVLDSRRSIRKRSPLPSDERLRIDFSHCSYRRITPLTLGAASISIDIFRLMVIDVLLLLLVDEIDPG
jgi:hypothetical protein